jgi:hypothetical protein
MTRKTSGLLFFDPQDAAAIRRIPPVLTRDFKRLLCNDAEDNPSPAILANGFNKLWKLAQVDPLDARRMMKRDA